MGEEGCVMEVLCQKLIAAGQRVIWWMNRPMDVIAEQTASLRELTVASVTLRLLLAMLLGGAIGLERGRKNRPAGFRTYMLVCMGSAMAMLMGQYTWLLGLEQGIQTDMTRIAAQVINGIGFLGAGTILVTQKQQVKGLTTAAGLWASACMGLAIGAGFYSCALLAFGTIMVAVLMLPKIEAFLMETSRNMDIYVEFSAMGGVRKVVGYLKSQNIQIYDVDISHAKQAEDKRSNAVFSVRLGKRQSHTKVMEQLSHLDSICAIKEL